MPKEKSSRKKKSDNVIIVNGEEYEYDPKITAESKEKDIQKAVVQFIRKYYPDVVFCASVGEVNEYGLSQAQRFSKIGSRIGQGYLPGYPDIQFNEPRGKFHGLFLELKKPKGKVDEKQVSIRQKLLAKGYQHHITYNYLSTLRKIVEYMNLGPFQFIIDLE